MLHKITKLYENYIESVLYLFLNYPDFFNLILLQREHAFFRGRFLRTWRSKMTSFLVVDAEKGLSKEFILVLVFWVILLNCKYLAIVDMSVVFRKQLELLKQDLNLADLDTSKWSWFFLSYRKLPKQDLVNRLLKIMIKCILLIPVKIFW